MIVFLVSDKCGQLFDYSAGFTLGVQHHTEVFAHRWDQAGVGVSESEPDQEEPF